MKPPVSAYYAESMDPNKYWRSYGSISPKIKFWGKSVEITPNGLVTIDLPEYFMNI